MEALFTAPSLKGDSPRLERHRAAPASPRAHLIPAPPLSPATWVTGAPLALTGEAKLPGAGVPGTGSFCVRPAPSGWPELPGRCGHDGASPFLASVLHNGLGRYVQQLQRLSFSLSRDAPSSRGAREFVEREVADFARRNPGVVIYVNSRPCCVPRVVAEYLNGAVREESIHCKSVEEIATLVQKLADQSGLEVIRIRKPFHTDSPSIQGQWHPFTNKPTTLGGLRPREVQDAALAQTQVP
ncbi:hypothetical protein PANDA_001745 [Ailuropoda melanoleuca]|uniref:Large ribosomal subunit protein mL43 n=1 Tax=Ailuropoda melanoleuca TaxID=9646 RepID=D2GXT9_AILME|nr:hypothetical protein PANDA_001745 [Ailuropoda melanoleuca]